MRNCQFRLIRSSLLHLKLQVKCVMHRLLEEIIPAAVMFDWLLWALARAAPIIMILAYLARVNHQLGGTPREVRRLAGPRWTPDVLKGTYKRFEQHPIDYTDKLPPRLHRRYVVTGGSGECQTCRCLEAGEAGSLDIRYPPPLRFTVAVVYIRIVSTEITA